MKDIIKILNDDLMPTALNKNNDEYKCVWGDKDFTPLPTITQSSDYQCGALCNELEYMRAFIQQISTTIDLDDLEGEYLEKIADFMLRLERIYDETDSNFRNRIKSLVQRNGDTSWMTKWSMIAVFSYYFDEDNIYCINNVIDTDLVLNGDFETGDLTSWTSTPSAPSVITVESTDYFEGGEVCKFTNSASTGTKSTLAQSFSSLSAGLYTLHFFTKDDGNCSGDPVEVFFQRTSDSFYWNFVLEVWQTSATSETLKSFAKTTLTTRYEDRQTFFILSGTDTVTVTFQNAVVSEAYDFYLDKIMFGEKLSYPSFYLFVVTSATAGGYMNAWPTGADPVGGTVYTYASFLDNDYILGSGAGGTLSFYENLLDIIKPAGVYVKFEIIEREV